jgi:hypothetical protein
MSGFQIQGLVSYRHLALLLFVGCDVVTLAFRGRREQTQPLPVVKVCVED